MADAARLTVALDDHPHVQAIRSGALSDPAVTLDFVDADPIHRAFAPMVRRQAYEMAELAVVTALQALDHGKPIILLPVVITARLQRGCIITLAGKKIDPRSLVGQPVGVRAYTQTTGMWVRAALREDYRLPVEEIAWVTQEEAHVEEYRDPDFVSHEGTGKSLPDQLRDGDIVAAILGKDLPKSDEFAPLIPDHRAVDEAWVAKHHFMPTNHLVVVSREAYEAKPKAIRAAYDLLRRGAEEAKSPVTLFGAEALRKPLAFIIEECVRQRLIKTPFDADDLLAPAEAILHP